MTPATRRVTRVIARVTALAGLSVGQLRKLTAFRKSIGGEIGEWAFAEWLSSQPSGKRTDRNAELIVGILWPLVRPYALSRHA